MVITYICFLLVQGLKQSWVNMSCSQTEIQGTTNYREKGSYGQGMYPTHSIPHAWEQQEEEADTNNTREYEGEKSQAKPN